MEKKNIKPSGYWNVYENCKNEALKYDNIKEFAKGYHIYFPFLTYDLDHNFKMNDSIFSVCKREQYETTPKLKTILSFNRNAKRDHRFWFYNFCKK